MAFNFNSKSISAQSICRKGEWRLHLLATDCGVPPRSASAELTVIVDASPPYQTSIPSSESARNSEQVRDSALIGTSGEKLTNFLYISL
ncbi:unnamed protein product [Protopolystoma xenopodis]|uniref:Cadherin domain-containing protein n=1 Tax=Protopolystoma xenopodis TaxID=117903 RepID=A0A448WVA6_9PLAT|nr:unnamed protein product [Protopolystoma xenopodis]